jgi:hypothetical protein
VTPEVAAGVAALVAAAATVVGAVALVLFFARGQPWGTVNDASTVVLMLALIPVALLVATLESETVTTVALVVAGVGILAMAAVAILQALLVARRVTFAQSKGPVLFGSMVVGIWYVASGLLATRTGLEGLPAWLAIAAGTGFVAVSLGFAIRDERHPLSTAGGALAFAGSTAFLVLLGSRLVTGDLVAPSWNA